MPIGSKRAWIFSAVAVSAVGVPPDYSSGEIGDVLNTTVEVLFNESISSPTSDYKTGVTIKANAVSQTISTATRQANHKLVHYVLDTALDADDTITWEYDDDLGDMEAEDDATPLGDVSAQAVTNWIGTHLYFNQADDSAWVGAV
jgi:hypothetical protein